MITNNNVSEEVCEVEETTTKDVTKEMRTNYPVEQLGALSGEMFLAKRRYGGRRLFAWIGDVEWGIILGDDDAFMRGQHYRINTARQRIEINERLDETRRWVAVAQAVGAIFVGEFGVRRPHIPFDERVIQEVCCMRADAENADDVTDAILSVLGSEPATVQKISNATALSERHIKYMLRPDGALRRLCGVRELVEGEEGKQIKQYALSAQ
ncbi:hypothetical protein [Poriferisphaera sp. WC338]|uniref:hypothetical protein n=1 Tax=Poriferisphaera sp. WC338 TaxID=3425129 RepID=UPI003D813B6F